MPSRRLLVWGAALAGVLATAGCLSPVPVAVAAGSEPTAPSREWIVMASAGDPVALVALAQRKGLFALPGISTLRSDDCEEMKPGLFVVALSVAQAASSAGKQLQDARRLVADAYPRRCTPRPGTLAERLLPAVDPSFGRLSSRPVNWKPSDAVARVEAGVLIRPWFAPGLPNDPREGLRMAVEFLPEKTGSTTTVVERDCSWPEVARSDTHLAVACVIEQIAEQPIYRTRFLRIGAILDEVEAVDHCRAPSFPEPGKAQCRFQEVGEDGTVTERVKEVAL